MRNEKMKRGLFLDDYRNPSDVYWCRYPKDIQWEVVRSYDSFIGSLISGRQYDFISYDHDLEEFHYKDAAGVLDFDYNAYEEKCGWHCALYAKSHYGGRHPTWCVHSLNERGAANIEKLLGE